MVALPLTRSTSRLTKSEGSSPERKEFCARSRPVSLPNVYHPVIGAYTNGWLYRRWNLYWSWDSSTLSAMIVPPFGPARIAPRSRENVAVATRPLSARLLSASAW